jgi:reactive intermediate/imine deaminase
MERQTLGRNVGSYSLGVVVPSGRTVYISGQIAQDAQGNAVGLGDFEAQVRQVFDNIKRLVEEAGGTMEHIVKITTFLTRLDEYAVFSRVRGEYFSGPKPASSTVKVAGLISDEYLIEVEAVAVIP